MSTSIAQSRTAFSPAMLGSRDVESVSVIIPCLNEEKFIGKALANLADQYTNDNYEIVVVDGGSTDRTLEIVDEFKQRHSFLNVVIVDNPTGAIPHALNLGIRAARGNIIARIDAHAAPSLGYIRRCVEVLARENAGVVGMPCSIQPGADTSLAQAIAIAVSHPFGIGDAKYRLNAIDSASTVEEVDTVAFACFRKSLWSDLGGFNEKLLTNEDYDFNYRVRQRGSKVILDHAEHCDYFARPDFGSLARQYLRYGFWKAQMVKQQPRSLKLRHLVAPAFVSAIAVSAFLGLISVIGWYALTLLIALYLGTAVVFSFQAVRHRGGSLKLALPLPLIFATIHFCWGLSFLFGIVKSPRG